MNFNRIAVVACVAMVIAAVAACNSHRATVAGFPGLAIEGTCRLGSTVVQYSEVDPAYPGERVSGDLLDPNYFGAMGELPLPCVDPRNETYRVYQSSGGEFGGFILVGITRSISGSRLWAISKPYGGQFMKVRRAGRILLDSEWDAIANQMSAIRFWTQPALPPPDPTPTIYMDWRGMLHLEGYNGDRYHGVTRFPEDEGVKSVTRAFIDLARPLLETAEAEVLDQSVADAPCRRGIRPEDGDWHRRIGPGIAEADATLLVEAVRGSDIVNRQERPTSGPRAGIVPPMPFIDPSEVMTIRLDPSERGDRVYLVMTGCREGKSFRIRIVNGKAELHSVGFWIS